MRSFYSIYGASLHNDSRFAHAYHVFTPYGVTCSVTYCTSILYEERAWVGARTQAAEQEQAHSVRTELGGCSCRATMTVTR